MGLKTTERVESIVKGAIEQLGYTLCDVEFAKEYGNWVLTLFIDQPGGVTIDDCEKVSRLVDPILDEADPIEQAYYLSVSSLGLDRPLKKDADFMRSIGAEVSVKLYAPQDGKKELSGKLVSFTADAFQLETAAGTTDILRKDAALVKPVITF